MNDFFKPATPDHSDRGKAASATQEVRCAVRFPLTLPVVVSTGNGEHTALTRNVSAS